MAEKESNRHGTGFLCVDGSSEHAMASPMSLRTRESCSLALKHIFDQINADANAKKQANSMPQMLPLNASGSANHGRDFSSPWTISRSNPSSSSDSQPTAQLTIFYSGTMNVYDDVPMDKANAIMLLAGHGNSITKEGTQNKNLGDSPNINPVSLAVGPFPGRVITSGEPNLVPPSAANAVTSTTSSTVSCSLSPSVVAQVQPATVPQRSHTGIELPHARKASLARFLEKRKDRAQRQPAQSESCDMTKDESPPCPKKQACDFSEKDKPGSNMLLTNPYQSSNIL